MMQPEDVPAEMVERAAEAAFLDRWPTKVTGYTWGMADETPQDMYRSQARAALAAVLPEIQARALRDAKAWIKSSSDLSTLDGDWAMAWNLSTSHALAVLDDEAARLTDTTEGTTT